ncbi:hypothetical protein DL98DRAFT_526762 [Cadophora sp. DSE1049]|nr:hypothetical protein DL98DRAFT_526762 [Cadophora sp. DSE1049]
MLSFIQASLVGLAIRRGDERTTTSSDAPSYRVNQKQRQQHYRCVNGQAILASVTAARSLLGYRHGEQRIMFWYLKLDLNSWPSPGRHLRSGIYSKQGWDSSLVRYNDLISDIGSLRLVFTTTTTNTTGDVTKALTLHFNVHRKHGYLGNIAAVTFFVPAPSLKCCHRYPLSRSQP